MEQRLLEIGDWLKVNGEAIDGTRTAGRSAQWTDGKRATQAYGEYMVKYNLMDQVGQQPENGQAVKQVFFTKKPDALDAIAIGWPGKQLVLRDVTVPAGATVTMLGVPGALKTTLTGTTLTITTPDLGPDGAPCHHAYAFKITGATVAPKLPLPSQNNPRGALELISPLRPAAAQRLDELDADRVARTECLRKRSLCLKQRALRVHRLERADQPPAQSLVKVVRRPSRRRERTFLRGRLLAVSPRIAESILHLAKRYQRPLPILGDRLFVTRLNRLQRRTVARRFEYRQRDTWSHRPLPAVPREQILQLDALRTQCPRQSHGRQKSGLRHSDRRTLRRGEAFGFRNIRTAQQQLRGQAHRGQRRGGGNAPRAATRNCAGASPQSTARAFS